MREDQTTAALEITVNPQPGVTPAKIQALLDEAAKLRRLQSHVVDVVVYRALTGLAELEDVERCLDHLRRVTAAAEEALAHIAVPEGSA